MADKTKVGGNDVVELHALRQPNGAGLMAIHERVHADFRARVAEQFVSRWGMVAGVPDGEDSAGRQKFRLMTPSELVDRAMVTTDKLMAKFRDYGWLVDAPSYQELKATIFDSESEERPNRR